MLIFFRDSACGAATSPPGLPALNSNLAQRWPACFCAVLRPFCACPDLAEARVRPCASSEPAPELMARSISSWSRLEALNGSDERSDRCAARTSGQVVETTWLHRAEWLGAAHKVPQLLLRSGGGDVCASFDARSPLRCKTPPPPLHPAKRGGNITYII